MHDDEDLLERLRDLRKRRGRFSASPSASRELNRLRALLPANSLEREVFERAEILGRPYKVIASELNLSERHLYRIRRRMMAMIDASETELGTRHRSSASTGIELVATLLRYGKPLDAARALRRLASDDVSNEARLDLHRLAAAVALECGRPSDALQHLERMRALARSFAQERSAGAWRRVAMAEASFDYHHGLYETTLARAEQALAPMMDGSVADDELQAVARDLLFLGIVHQEGGSPQRAVCVLDRAETLLRRMPAIPLADLANVYVHRAFARGALPGALDDAAGDAARAVDIAQTNGLCFEDVWAHLATAVVQELQNQPGEALRSARHALDLARATLGGDPLARTHFISSRIEVLANDTDETLEHLDEARGLVAENSILGPIVHLVEARVHHTHGDARRTIESATRAIDAFTARSTSTHYLGAAYLARAAAGESLGHDVRSDAEHALTLLSRGGWVSDQERASALAARAGLRA